MTTWHDMLGLDEPVSGNSEEYDTAASETQVVQEAVAVVAGEFARLRGDGSVDEMQGQAGDQLRVIVEAIDGSLTDLPRVLADVQVAFRSHAETLAELERRAERAVAQARLDWNQKIEAESDVASGESALSATESRIHDIMWSPTYDPVADQPALDSLYSLKNAQVATISTATSQVTAAEGRLENARATHGEIVAEETALREATSGTLKNIDLGDLDDPNAAMAFFGAVAGGLLDFGEFLYGIGESFVHMVDALADGRGWDALWHLSDLIGDVLTVLAVVGLVVAILATGGGALVFVGVALAATKLAVDVALAATKHPHPETGETMSWKSVAIDAVLLGISLATMGASNAARGSSTPFKDIASNWREGVRFGADHDQTLREIIRTSYNAGNVDDLVAGAFFHQSDGFLTMAEIALDFGIGGNPVGDGAGLDGGFVNGVASLFPDGSPITNNVVDGWDIDYLTTIAPSAAATLDIETMITQVSVPPADLLTMAPRSLNYELVEVGS